MAPPPIPDAAVRARRLVRWLYGLAALTFGLIVFGGFVRLTRSGLSIVEWNPIIGILPPIGTEAWETEFAKYRQTPEFQLVNHAMPIDGYRRIFYIEWAHRLIARLAGLYLAVPLAWFVWRGAIPRRRIGVFVAIALLFLLQAFLGWFMVSSGLLDEPAVSHYRLTIHLLAALLLLALTTWTAMSLDDRNGPAIHRPAATRHSTLGLVALAVIVVQIAYGGLVAGLKAGHVSYTWPLMGGSLVPAGLFDTGGSWWAALTASPAAVHWIHRWFAVVAAAVVAWLVVEVRGARTTRAAREAANVSGVLVGVQVALGIGVLLTHVPLVLALLHQAVGLGLFVAVLVVNHQLRRGGD